MGHKNIIKKWISNVISSGSWKNYDDLHIDYIYGKKEIKENEIAKGIEALRFAKSILDENFEVILGISLLSKNVPEKFNYNSLQEIQAGIDHTPPSLYLFEKGFKDWTNNLDKCEHVKIKNYSYHIYYFDIEIDEYEEVEFRRGIYIKIK